MIFIVEGIDRVGKTTLVNKITKECNEVKHFLDSFINFSYYDFNTTNHVAVKADRKDVIANTEKMNSLVNFFEQFSDEIGNILIDRFHLSEFVYGLADRNYLSLEAFEFIDERLSNLDTVIIYVEPKDLEWSSQQHGSSLSRHLDIFENVIKKTKCEVIKCNFDTFDEVVFKIKERIANDKRV